MHPTTDPVTPLSGHTAQFLTSDFREKYEQYEQYERSDRPTGLAHTGRLESSPRTSSEKSTRPRTIEYKKIGQSSCTAPARVVPAFRISLSAPETIQCALDQWPKIDTVD